MKELISLKNRKCCTSVRHLRQLVAFNCILSGMIISCSASSTTEDTLSSSTTTLLESEDLYCSQESCQELRERVESLEEAFRAFVSALSNTNDEANRHFATVSRKMSRNRAVQSLLSASASTNIRTVFEHPSKVPYIQIPSIWKRGTFYPPTFIELFFRRFIN